MNRPPSLAAVAAVGVLALASAMGIGRFAFTPLLPLMQSASGMTLSQGSLLAFANYFGYFAGALVCWMLHPGAARAAQLGLIGVAAATFAMGVTADAAWWWLLRFGAGVASAFVLIGISGWTLQALAERNQMRAAGWVFSGVGVGIAFAGMIAMLTAAGGALPGDAWRSLGIAGGMVAALAWRPLSRDREWSAETAGSREGRFDRAMWQAVLCYGAFGLGYIVPATYLPAQARALAPDPLLFGWTWPVFGVAAAVSTVLASRLVGGAPPRRVWGYGHLAMAAGVAAPLVPGLGAVLFAAVAVGGTFMVVTQAAMQHARSIAGAFAGRLMAAMTTAFAVGQLLGPLLVQLAATRGAPIAVPSIVAATLLIASAFALLRRPASDSASVPSRHWR